MMKKTQRQNRMGCSSLMPDEDGKQNDSGAHEGSLHQPDLSLTEIHKCPHQATATGAGEKGTGKIESAYAMPNAFVHSGDDEERSHNCNWHVYQESPAPCNVRHDQCSEEWAGYTRDGPCAAGRAQRPAAFVRRINDSEQNKR